MVLVEKP